MIFISYKIYLKYVHHLPLSRKQDTPFAFFFQFYIQEFQFMLDVLIYIRSFLNMSLFLFSECKKDGRNTFMVMKNIQNHILFLSFFYHFCFIVSHWFFSWVLVNTEHDLLLQTLSLQAIEIVPVPGKCVCVFFKTVKKRSTFNAHLDSFLEP